MGNRAKNTSRPIDTIRYLLHKERLREIDLLRYSASKGHPALLGRSFFSNSRRANTFPSKRALAQIIDFLQLTTDGGYRIYGVLLDNLAVIERRLNPTRTRPVESYIFDRDALLPFPKRLNISASPLNNAFLDDLVQEWQPTSVRSFDGLLCPSHSPCSFLQLGMDDDTSSPTIPRGSLVQSVRLSNSEPTHLSSKDWYIVQHQHGYLCTQCLLEEKQLKILSGGSYYQGERNLLLGGEAELIGKATACFIALPLPPKGNTFCSSEGPGAPVIPLSQYETINAAIASAHLRYKMTDKEIDERAEQLRNDPSFGFHITSKHIRRLEQERTEPHMPTCLAITPIFSFAYHDILTIYNVPPRDSGRWSLNALQRIWGTPGIFSDFVHITAPFPETLYAEFFGHWHDFPRLLYHLRARLAGRRYRLFYLHQSTHYRGLDPLLPSRSLLAIEPILQPLKTTTGSRKEDWERPIYLLRVRREWIVSYIEIASNKITIVPHPKSQDMTPRVLPTSEVEVHGIVIGALFLVPQS